MLGGIIIALIVFAVLTGHTKEVLKSILYMVGMAALTIALMVTLWMDCAMTVVNYINS